MPCYDYKCDNCGWEDERIVPISKMDDLCEEECPNCGKKEIKRIFGAPIINLGFRGSSITSKSTGQMRERLTEIKKNYGKKLCKGIDL